ncbi:MAG: hypothetical protein ACSLFN_01510 [Candidatus Limnocylindrales bacterium]
MLTLAPSGRRRYVLVAVGLVVVSLVAACTPGDATPTPIATSADVGPSATAVAVADGASSPSVILASPSPAPAAPALAASPLPPSPSADPPEIAEADPEPFAMNLATRADFVGQYTFEWCVGASLQMALNMATDRQRTTRVDQGDLWAMARDRSSSPFGGANPRGWTAALNDLGIGPYRLVSLPTFEGALAVAVEAIRATDRPVGLVMWRGRHAWVMSGFEASVDPASADAFEVTGIRVHDPLYPHGSTVWGQSPKPNSLISPATLAKQFVVRDSTRVDLGVPPGYLLVLPVVNEA